MPPRSERRPSEADVEPPETPGIARVVAIANQKGGVGKSTTAVSLGAALADLGYRILVVDLDPQGNASTGLGIRHEARDITVYNVIVSEASLEDAIVQTPVARLQAVPSTIDLAGAEIELVSQFSRETRLKKALQVVREGRYDFVFLDCPPSLGLLTINALTAAEELIVPIQCEYYALEGLGQLLRNVSLVQQNINQDLRLTGIVMTMFDPRTKLSEQVVDEVRKFFGDLVYDVIIPRTVRLSEAPGFGQPITVYDPKSKGAESYRLLAAEVARRPPPAEPMPVFDEMPAVVLTAVEDAVTQGPPDAGDAEDLEVPTVHDLDRREERHAQAEVEVDPEAAALEGMAQAVEALRPKESRPPLLDSLLAAQPQAGPQTGSAQEEEARGSSGPKARQAARAKPARQRPAAESGERSGRTGSPARGGSPKPARTRSDASAETPEIVESSEQELDEDEFSQGAGSRRRQEAARRPGRPDAGHERRVVIIDEDAEFVVPPEPSVPPSERTGGVGNVGATLEEEAPRKRRWRLFRKGGG